MRTCPPEWSGNGNTADTKSTFIFDSLDALLYNNIYHQGETTIKLRVLCNASHFLWLLFQLLLLIFQKSFV